MIYLLFNEGYSASSGDSLIDVDLTDEAIRLARLLVDLLPDLEVRGREDSRTVWVKLA